MIQSQHFRRLTKVTTIVKTIHSQAEASRGEHLVLASIDNQQHRKTKTAKEIQSLRSQLSKLP